MKTKPPKEENSLEMITAKEKHENQDKGRKGREEEQLEGERRRGEKERKKERKGKKTRQGTRPGQRGQEDKGKKGEREETRRGRNKLFQDCISLTVHNSLKSHAKSQKTKLSYSSKDNSQHKNLFGRPHQL